MNTNNNKIFSESDRKKVSAAFEYISENEIEKLIEILSEIDVNSKMYIRSVPDTLSLIAYAAFRGRYIITVLLHNYGAIIEPHDTPSPLSMSVQVGSAGNNSLCDHEQKFKIAKYLLEKSNANVDFQDKHSCNPLFLAIENNRVERRALDYVKLLIDHGSNVNHLSEPMGFHTALSISCLKGFHDMTTLLLLHGAEIVVTNNEATMDVLKNAITGFYEGRKDCGRISTIDLLLSVDRRGFSDEVLNSKRQIYCPLFQPIDPRVKKLVNQHALQKPILSLKFLTIRSINTNRVPKPHNYPPLLLQYNHKLQNNKRN